LLFLLSSRCLRWSYHRAPLVSLSFLGLLSQLRFSLGQFVVVAPGILDWVWVDIH
jgi:hypothetical protein